MREREVVSSALQTPLLTARSHGLQRYLFTGKIRLTIVFEHRGSYPISQLNGCGKVAPLR